MPIEVMVSDLALAQGKESFEVLESVLLNLYQTKEPYHVDVVVVVVVVAVIAAADVLDADSHIPSNATFLHCWHRNCAPESWFLISWHWPPFPSLCHTWSGTWKTRFFQTRTSTMNK